MKWMNKVLIVYLFAITLLCAVIMFSKTDLNYVSDAEFKISTEALNYALENDLNDNYIDPVLEFIASYQLSYLGEGTEVLFTAPSTNPYLYQRDWSVYVEYSSKPDIEIQSSLFKNNTGVYYLMAQCKMPLSEVNQELTKNFIHFGFSDEYQVSNVYSSFYFHLKDKYTRYDAQSGYDEDNKTYTLPTSVVDESLNAISVVGYVFIEIPVGNNTSFFESSVTIYDGTNYKEEPGIVFGFSKLVFTEREEYYSVSSSWIKYREEIE